MKVVCIVQARVGSSRLPGKVLKEICGKTVLEHDINRLKKVSNIDEVVVATTTEEQDINIVNEAKRLGVKYFRGSESDVLSRYYYAAKENIADVVVRVTSDCPCIDPNIVEDVIGFFKEMNKNNDVDYVSNTLELTFPLGYDVEVFTYGALEKAFNEGKEKYEREHVTPYIYTNYDKFNIKGYKNNEDFSYIRLTLDTEKDFIVIKNVYEKLYYENNFFGFNEVKRLVKSDDSIFKYNEDVIQKTFME